MYTRNTNPLSTLSFISVVFIVIMTTACSTKKNTSLSRGYHAMTTRFNVLFNGRLSYDEGLDYINKANKEEYSTIIPMYPISRHANAQSATVSLDRTIEKCRKSIKLHSIKVKPDKNYSKTNDPNYMYFYNQEEFNPVLKDAWLMLGKAEFHKADFLASVGTFSYISRHYSYDKNLVAICQLWITRAYAEMGWIFEAEKMLADVKQDNLKASNTGLFASVNADLLLKKRQYKEAIPFLELALDNENDHYLKTRFQFLLGELYQLDDNHKAAYKQYTRVIRSNPAYEMSFNAQLRRAQLNNISTTSSQSELRGMLKNTNNKTYLDQIYFALGNTYMITRDTLKAIENYKLAIDKSTRNGIDKAIAAVTLGDLYYKLRKYVQAQPYYDDASKILTKDHPDFARVTRLSDMLGELVVQYNTYTLQDSLQRLAQMPEAKRLEIVNAVIKKLTDAEKAEAQKAQQEAQTKINEELDINNMNQNGGQSQNPFRGTNSQSAAWYFYNPELTRNGQQEFERKWGKRKLEDNWRRSNKSGALFGEEDTNSNENLKSDNQKMAKDSTDTVAKKKISDVKNPNYYLKQIPLTQKQLDKSNKALSEALFEMGLIYQEKIEDFEMAQITFDEFIKRFGTNKQIPDVYYQMYIMKLRCNNAPEAEKYRQILINNYPDSKYGKSLASSDFVQKQKKMYQEQDSIYIQTYSAFNKSDYNSVFKNVELMRKSYPNSDILPKFLLVNALSLGKKGMNDKFKSALSDLIVQYPTSDVTALAKDIISQIKLGKEAKAGNTGGSLLNKRDEISKMELANVSDSKKFSTDKQTKHKLLLISESDTKGMNKLQYQIALFNFSHFMIKDFDLEISKIDNTKKALLVNGLESMEEAQWYENTLLGDEGIRNLLSENKVKRVLISDDNYKLIKSEFTLEDYLIFISGSPNTTNNNKLTKSKVSTKKVKK